MESGQQQASGMFGEGKPGSTVELRAAETYLYLVEGCKWACKRVRN
jgi:hypothetical protein